MDTLTQLALIGRIIERMVDAVSDARDEILDIIDVEGVELDSADAEKIFGLLNMVSRCHDIVMKTWWGMDSSVRCCRQCGTGYRGEHSNCESCERYFQQTL